MHPALRHVVLNKVTAGSAERTLGSQIAMGTAFGTSATNATAWYDGTTSQANTSCTTTTTNNCFFGNTPASSVRVFEARVFGSNNHGFVNTTNPSVTILLFGKTGAAPATFNNGTELGSITFTDTTNESAGRAITCGDPDALWDHVWCVFDKGADGNNWRIAEIQFFEAV